MQNSLEKLKSTSNWKFRTGWYIHARFHSVEDKSIKLKSAWLVIIKTCTVLKLIFSIGNEAHITLLHKKYIESYKSMNQAAIMQTTPSNIDKEF